MSFQSYLQGLGAHTSPFLYNSTPLGQPSDHDGSYSQYAYSKPNYSMGGDVQTTGQWTGNSNPNWDFNVNQGRRHLYDLSEGTQANRWGDMQVDAQGKFLGYGADPDSIYAANPLLARQYQESIADGGLGAAQAEQLRIQNEQQRLAAEQARQASRQTYTPQYQGGNIMGLMQYQPQQQQAPQQQAPQQGLLGGGLHRPGFVANPGAGNGQTGGVQ